MFKVGDLVTGVEGCKSRYNVTSEFSLCKVITVYSSGRIEIRTVAHAEGRECTDDVDPDWFEYCTYDEFMERYPNAKCVNGYKASELKKIVNSGKTPVRVIREVQMRKDSLGDYVLSDAEKEGLRKEIITLLEEYGYEPTEAGVNAILEEWVKNKGWMINLFKKHPKYNGKFQIVFDSDYHRVCDRQGLRTFGSWLYSKRKEILHEVVRGGFTYKEIKSIVDRLDSIGDYMWSIERNYSGYHATVNGKSYDEIMEEKNHWGDKLRTFKEWFNGNRSTLYADGSRIYKKEDYQISENLRYFSDLVSVTTDHLATEDFVNSVNSWFPSVRAKVGQKVTRIVGKVCKLVGVDKFEDYNKQYAKYCDALNPLTIKRFTVMSCHPVDYLTMSFGNSWASCHTIDKLNKRNMDNGYSGGYSSGTLSYMLDGASFVFYTLDKDYQGDMFELEPKINRNMFHMGEDKLIQARVYPQATDGEEGIYKQFREVAQKVIADCLEVPNLWINKKGSSTCSLYISSKGTHYKDYNNFEDCNVSFLKSSDSAEDEYINRVRIFVGHAPICPQCGQEHTWAESVECRTCYHPKEKCKACGQYHYLDDMHRVDGEYYCSNCSFYCAYHDEYELGQGTCVSDYYSGGLVCDRALAVGSFSRCDHCGEWHSHRGYGFFAADDSFFCCPEHAQAAGYRRSGLRWVKIAENTEREAV